MSPTKVLLFILLALGMSHYKLHGQTGRGDSSAPVIVEVMNEHFTLGQRIPSVYLRVFSDRAVECHTLRVTGDEADVVKKGILTQAEFREVKAVVEQPELRRVKGRYELTHTVIDSWMEWKIRIPRTTGIQDIAIADFASTPLRIDRPYPAAVVKLGCAISKLRDEVYGDEFPGRRNECKKIWMAKHESH